MFPISDENPSKSVPYVNYTIIVINILIFFFELTLNQQQLAKFIYEYGIVPARIFFPSFTAKYEFTTSPLTTFFTSMFLHGGWMHIIFNMWALFIFGDNVEDKLGHFKYLIFYLGSGLIAGLIHSAFNYNSTMPSIGASGAIAGVMGAYAVLFPFARIKTLFIFFIFPIIVYIPAFFYIMFWFFIQFFSGTLSLMGAEGSPIAWWAHIGGFLGGILLLFVFKKDVRFPPHRYIHIEY